MKVTQSIQVSAKNKFKNLRRIIDKLIWIRNALWKQLVKI
jgi:hypothetical protein